jgi:hypothetical protein
MKNALLLSIANLMAAFVSGCASTGKTYPGPDGVLYHQHPDLQETLNLRRKHRLL